MFEPTSPCSPVVAVRPHGHGQAVVFLDRDEFKSTWLGNKSIYRTRMAMANGGELIVMAPGVNKFGEDPGIDSLIRQVSFVCVSTSSTLCACRLGHAAFPCVFTCCRQSQNETQICRKRTRIRCWLPCTQPESPCCRPQSRLIDESVALLANVQLLGGMAIDRSSFLDVTWAVSGLESVPHKDSARRVNLTSIPTR